MNKNYYSPKLDDKIGNTERDIILIVEKGFIHYKLLINHNNLPSDFFDLSSGFAGNLLQKLVNYHIKTAFVIKVDLVKSEYFKQMVNEANAKDEYRFFDNVENAEKWLLKG